MDNVTIAQPTRRADALTITSVEVRHLEVAFESLYDGLENVPDWLLYPAASHLAYPRSGQFATLVRIGTADGLVGVGEAYGLPRPEVTATVISELLRPALIGRDAMATEALWEDMYSAQKRAGHTKGFYLEAISGIDMALWDLRGKAAGLPVHRLLGGPVREWIPCYASPVPFMPTPDESAARAATFVEQGFHRIKIKLGRGIETDVDHVHAVREKVGDDIEILVDANCAYRVDAAIRLGQRLAELGVTWLEEPLETDDLDGLAEVRGAVPMAVVNGETEFTKYGVREALTRRAIDIVMPNLARAGGITEARRIAALADAFHVEVSPHGVGSAINMSAALQFCAATPNIRFYEYNQLPNPLRTALLTHEPEFRDSALRVPDGPGLGVTLDDDAVEDYTVGMSA
jgi:L-alanine-DL-glutamate epimerase-like enolase superfamily enzyme